jgi:hypothetical protein
MKALLEKKKSNLLLLNRKEFSCKNILVSNSEYRSKTVENNYYCFQPEGEVDFEQ